MKTIVVFGAGGHAKVVIDLLEKEGSYRILGILDQHREPGDVFWGYPVLGDETYLRSHRKWRHHHSTFLHPEKGIKVELHWRLNPSPSREPSFEDLWARRRRSELVREPVYYLGREDLFLFLVSHGARHGWSRLRWLLDIRQLLRQPLEPGRLLRLLRQHAYSHIGGQALVLSSSLLDAQLPPLLLPLAADRRARRLAGEAMFYMERMVNLHTPPLPVEVERFHKRHLFRLLTVRQRALFILSLLFPYPEDAETLPLPKPLHFLYVPLRPFLWAWRKTVGVTR